MAAQALVTESYKNPRFTFETNTLGTLNILESLRYINKKCVVVIITSDKVYKNFEVEKGFMKGPFSKKEWAPEIEFLYRK